MDKARKKTERQLKKIEHKIGRAYQNPALISINKEYQKYMKKVDYETRELYDAYKAETEQKAKEEKKKAYSDKVRELTLDSKEYNKLLKKMVGVLARTNADALDIANANMQAVYIENYNQVANECRRAGIDVEG